MNDLLQLLSPQDSLTKLDKSQEWWGSTLQIADEQQLLLPLWERLNANGITLPQSILDRWEPLVTQKVLEQLRRSQQLGSLITLLKDQDIDALAYKGPTLGHLAFGSAAGRESCDLDLLVAPADYQATVAVLLNDGFHFERSTIPRCYLKLSYEVAMIHPQRGVVVDLHRSFFGKTQSFPITLENHERYSVRIAGIKISTLNPEDLFFLLCVHGSKHAWRELRWVYDLVGLSSKQQLNWETIYRRARAAKLMYPVRVGLELSHQLFGSPVNALFFPDSESLKLSQRSLAYIFGSRPNLGQLQSYHWTLHETWSQHLKYLWHLLVHPHELDLEWVDLSPELWPLYYLLRPLRIAQKALSFGGKSCENE